MPARLRMGVPTVIAALACLLALSACGSSKPKQTVSRGNALIAFSKCMRAHGVTNFPDPGEGGGGINLDGTGINPAAPSFRAAQHICFKRMPGGGPQNQKPTAQEIAQARSVSECMRSHGITGFPDPIISSGGPPDINPANVSLAEDRGGVILEVPKTIDVASPAFKKAAKVCSF